MCFDATEAAEMARRTGQKVGPWMQDILRTLDAPSAGENWIASNRHFHLATLTAWIVLLGVQAAWFVTPSGELQVLETMDRSTLPLPVALHATALLAAWGLLCLRYRCRRPEPVGPRFLWVASLTVCLVAWLAPPDSRDLLDYVGYGRLLAIHHLSPWTRELGPDVSYPWSSLETGMAWGPAHLPVLWLAGLTTMLSPMLALYLVKAIWLLLHGASARLLEKAGTDRGLVLLYGLNPLVVFEVLVNGHPDGLVLFWSCLAWYGLQKQQTSLAVMAALGCALTWAPAGGLLLAAVLLFLLHQGRILDMLTGLAWLSLGGILLRLVFPGSWSEVAGLWPLGHPNLAANNETVRGYLWNERPFAIPASLWDALTGGGLLLGLVLGWRAQHARGVARAVVLVLAGWLAFVTPYAEAAWWTWILPWALVLGFPWLDWSLLIGLAMLWASYPWSEVYGQLDTCLVLLWLWWMRPACLDWRYRLLLGSGAAISLGSTLLLPPNLAALLAAQWVPLGWLAYFRRGDTLRRQTSSVTPDRNWALPE